MFPHIKNIPISRDSIKWEPPDSSLVKLNFDGSSRGNPGESSIRVCLRNHLGEVLSFYAVPISPSTNNMAEATTLLEGLIQAKRMYFSCLHIDGDSSIVINACVHKKSNN